LQIDAKKVLQKVKFGAIFPEVISKTFLLVLGREGD
jgi:hypothetical protein